MKRWRSAALVAALGLVVGIATPAWGQTTGQIRGDVTDIDGAPMPGVAVTISSESLTGVSRSTVSGENGSYWFTALPPGNYSVEAAIEGFKTQMAKQVRVNINSTATQNFHLVPEFTETLAVSSESPLVNVTSSSVGTNYESEFVKELPTNRNFYDMLSVSPGVATAAEYSDRQIAFGSNMQSNAWHIDGLEASAPETGTAWVYTNPAMIEEIQVMGVGAGAEFGNMLGAAFNVVTKSGTNQLHGTFDAYYQSEGLTDSNINFDQSEFPEFYRDEFWDVSATLGGPIKRDKAFFMLGYQYWRDGFSMPGIDPVLARTNYQDIYDVKITTNINDSNLLDVKGNYAEWGYPEAYPNYTPSATPKGEEGTNWMWGVNYQSIFTERTFLEARASGWQTEDDYFSLTGSTEPAFIDYSPPGGGPPEYSGGLLYPWTYESGTTQFDVAVSHFADEFIEGDHDFKFGVRYGKGTNDTKTSLTGSYYYRYVYEYDYYGTIYPYEYFYQVTYRPYYYGSEQVAISGYVNDSWRINERFTLNLGLRYDYHDANFPAYPVLDPGGVPTGQTIPEEHALTWKNWSPRVGFAYNLGSQYRTVIRGSAGLYYDGNVSGNWDSPPPDVPDFVYGFSSSPTGPFEEFFVYSAGANAIDPNLKAPKTVQYSLGFEHQIGNNYSIGVLGVYKDTTDLVGFEILDDGVWEPFPFTDPFTGNQYTLLNQIEPATFRKGNKPGFTAAGYLPEYWQKYKGVVLTFNRRMTGWWSLRSSYTWSKSNGLIPDLLDDTQFNPPYGNKLGSDPNNYINGQDQLLQGDREHMLRAQATFQLPFKMIASTALNFQDGRPYSRQIRVFDLNQSSTPVIMEPASNSQRYPSQSLLDFSIGKRWTIPGGGELKTDIQVFNLLNDTAYDEFVTLEIQEGETFVPDWWLFPRRIMLRVGVEY